MTAALRLTLRSLAALLLVLAVTGCGVNAIPTLEEAAKARWADVENQYQRRADLIPNLVETVKGAAEFERGVLTDVVEARSRVGQMNVDPSIVQDPERFQQFEKAQGALSSALSRLLVVVERYPDLKANQNYLALQAQLEGTENRIAVARRDYIDAVRAYNTELRTFPGIIWATLVYGDEPMQNFSATPGAETAPQVKFGGS